MMHGGKEVCISEQIYPLAGIGNVIDSVVKMAPLSLINMLQFHHKNEVHSLLRWPFCTSPIGSLQKGMQISKKLVRMAIRHMYNNHRYHFTDICIPLRNEVCRFHLIFWGTPS